MTKRSTVLDLLVPILAIAFGSCLIIFPYGLLYDAINQISKSGNGMVPLANAYERFKITLRILGLGSILFAGGLFYWKISIKDVLRRITHQLNSERRDFIRWLTIVTKREKRHLYVVAVLTIFGAVLRVWFINRPMQADETEIFLGYIIQPFINTFANYFPSDHILHNIFTRFFVWIFGTSPPAHRLSALIPGILLLPAIYFFSRQISTRRIAGVFTCLLFSVSSEAVEFATNSRAYSSIMLVFLLAASFTALLLRRERPWVWFLLSVFHGFGFMFHPTYLYPFVSCNVWMLLAKRTTAFQRTFLTKFFMANAITGIVLSTVYLPTVILSGPHRLLGNDFVKRYTYQMLMSDIAVKVPDFLRTFTADFPLLLKGLILLGATLFIFRHNQICRKSPNYLLVALFVTLALLLIRPHDIQVRYLIFLLPVFIASAGCGISVLAPRAPASLIILLGLGLCIFQIQNLKNGIQPSVESVTLDEGEKITELLKPLLKPGDQVVYPTARGANLQYYFYRAGLDPNYVAKGNGAERIFFVLNLRYKDEFAYSKNYQTFDPTQYTRPIVIAKFAGAEVSLLERIDKKDPRPNFLSGYPSVPAKADRFLTSK